MHQSKDRLCHESRSNKVMKN